MTDKNVIRQVLGCLMHRPQFLSEVDKYSLLPGDFSNRFEKYIFIAIDGLYRSGAVSISPVDVVNYMESNDAAKAVFEQFNGIEYLQDILDLSSAENFNYYYTKLKKLNLLRDLKKSGFDTSDFYIEDLTDKRAAEVNAEFEQLTTKDITERVKMKLLHLENTYSQSEEVMVESASDGFDELVEAIGVEIEVGRPLQGEIYTQVINGAMKGTLTIRSGSSGLGKTRQAVGDACLLAYPLRFEWASRKWEQVGTDDKILFIITEQTKQQVQKMILAYLTGINESRFKYGQFTNEEWAVIHTAQEIVKKYADRFTIIKMPNPTIESVKMLVRENCLLKNIDHVFYDYIFIGPALLREFTGFNLRNDEVLLMFATALKDLAVELNVTMFTSTQVNSAADETKTIRNEASLSGGRSTINKADNGAIMARPSPEEIKILEPLVASYGQPNMVTDIFKVRSGEWSQVRIWSIVDLGTLRKHDLFITDSRLEAIEGFFVNPTYSVQDWSDTEVQTLNSYIEELNTRKERRCELQGNN
jgi:replicative DNA helicase